MNIDILLEAVKDRGDLEQRWESITPEKSIFQIEIGKGDSKRGWFYTVYDGKCTLRGGIYSDVAGIFEDKEMNKYAEKTSKQIQFDRMPDYTVNFTGDDDFVKYIDKCRNSGSKAPLLKGSRKKGSKCSGEDFCSLIRDTAVKLLCGPDDTDDVNTESIIALRTMMRLVFDGLRDGDPVCAALCPNGRKSWYMSVSDPKETDWITVQGNQARVGINPLARPISSGGIDFKDGKQVLDCFSSGEKAGETCQLWDAVSHMIKKENLTK